MGNGPKAVVFDIGNVFVSWDPRFLYSQLIDDSDELDWFLANVVTLDWHTHHDNGRSFAEGCEILSGRFPQYKELIHCFDERWTETIGEAITSTVGILNELFENGVPCFALTNFSAEKFPEFAKEQKWVSLFEDIIVSGEVKLVKPDPNIFDLTMNRFGLVPGEAVFVDDRMENIIAGERVGLIGHHYTGEKPLKAALRDHGLLP